MNSGYYETLDENFTQALNLYEKNYSHNELVQMLKNGNIVQKQISALKLESVDSYFDADVLLSNLTGQDGKVREAVSLKIAEFMSDSSMLPFFDCVKNNQIFLDAIIDINSNICRNIINALSNLKNNNTFCSVFCAKLIILTNELLEINEKTDFRKGKYKVNKEVFKLYWCLETMYEFWDKITFIDLKKIILRCAKIQDYTIREKTAKILSRNFDDSDLKNVQYLLKHDENYYVRRF